MKKLFYTFMFTLVAMATLAAQGGVKGLVFDGTGEAIIGATVILDGTSTGTTTDYDGSFQLSNVAAGDYTLFISYVGYADYRTEVSIGNSMMDLGTINLEESDVSLKAVEVLASVAVDRRTPIAVTTLDGSEVEKLVGNNEYPEVLRFTPSTYVTKQGGGFGDARINVRGFDQRNVAVMINGIPVNDMENGWVFWSNWAGLSDVTSKLQVQRGLGATKLAAPTIGGSINIITDAAQMEQGGTASTSIGNDNYQKYGVSLNSGLLENGWAFTGQFTHTRGDGYVDGTKFRAMSYYLSATKNINPDHNLSFTVVGAPQWHHQRNMASDFDNINLNTFLDHGIRFNHTWGYKNGEEYNWRRNFYHKPKAFVNHYWDINDNMSLKTSAYVSFGRGGGTGPRGRLRTPGSVFDSFSGFGQGIHDEQGRVRFDDIVAYNQGAEVAGWGTKEAMTDGPMAGMYVVTNNGLYAPNDSTTTSQGSGFIRRASMNHHNWYGGLSTLTYELSPELTFSTGVDLRYYVGQHFRRLEDRLGADAYLSRSDKNNPENYITETQSADFGNFGQSAEENVLAYDNDGLVGWVGLFGQLEYTTDELTAFVSASGSRQSFKRKDYFNYLDSDPEQETDWEGFWGGTLKAGASYAVDENTTVFVNGGYLSRQPIFDNVFINFRNDVNPNAENQKIYAMEGGMGGKYANFSYNVNAYSTWWADRQFDRSILSQAVNNTNPADTIETNALAIFSGVNQRHAGLEIETSFKINDMIRLDGMLSMNQWIYTDNITTNLSITDSDDANNYSLLNDVTTLYAKDVRVGDAAQFTLGLSATITPAENLEIYTRYYYADELYANFNILEDQFLQPGGQAVKLPSYSLLDAGISQSFKWDGFRARVFLNINNVLNTRYVAELRTNIKDDASTPENEFFNNQGFFGFGRTWNAGVKVNF